MKKLGFLRDIWYWYTTSQGRYSEFATDSVLVWTGTRGIGIIPASAIAIWALALIALIFGIQPKSRAFKSRLVDAICLGCVLLFVMLLLAPNIQQSLYWWSGLATHTLPVIVFTIYIAFYQWVRVQRQDLRIVVITSLAGFCIAILNGGFSETFTAAQIALLIFWLAWLFLRKELDFRHPGPAYLASGLAGALVALTIAIISPGNAARQSYFPSNSGILAILQISFSGYFALLRDIFITPEKIIGLLGALVASIWFGKQIQPERNIKNWEPAAVFVTGFIILTYACFTPAAYGMSDAPPPRAQIIPILFLTFGALSAGFLWGQKLWSVSQLSAGTVRDNFGLLAIAVVLLMTAAGINGKHLYDSSAVYIKYARAWDQNEQKIYDAINTGQETVIIHSVRNWAGLNDPGDNPKFYVNYCMSKYYNINILADNTGMQEPEP